MLRRSKLQGVQEESAVRRLAPSGQKKRFLLHLKNENNQEGERICVICQATLKSGFSPFVDISIARNACGCGGISTATAR